MEVCGREGALLGICACNQLLPTTVGQNSVSVERRSAAFGQVLKTNMGNSPTEEEITESPDMGLMDDFGGALPRIMCGEPGSRGKLNGDFGFCFGRMVVFGTRAFAFGFGSFVLVLLARWTFACLRLRRLPLGGFQPLRHSRQIGFVTQARGATSTFFFVLVLFGVLHARFVYDYFLFI